MRALIGGVFIATVRGERSGYEQQPDATITAAATYAGTLLRAPYSAGHVQHARGEQRGRHNLDRPSGPATTGTAADRAAGRTAIAATSRD
jgi:hypothetical protein